MQRSDHDDIDLVTGGAGFIGSHLVDLLIAAGFRTIGLRPEDGVTVSLLGAVVMLGVGLVGGARFLVRPPQTADAGAQRR